MLKLRLFLPLLALALALPVCAQDQDNVDRDQQIANPNAADIPVYRVNVVERTTKAIDYRHKGHTLHFDLVGTSLMPDARGKTSVAPHTGRMKIDIDFDHMKQPQSFGPEYLTYVLWAITPEGRPENLGEVVLKDKHDKKSDLHVSSNLQAFGMIVTAEPYFAVTRPSNMVVMENEIGPDVKAEVQPINTRFEVLDKTEYSVDIQPADLPASRDDDRTPLDLMEAQNAVAIARATGADHYAESTYEKAKSELNDAENAYRLGKHATEVGTPARQAAQTAEDARILTIRKKHDEKLAQEREAARRRTEEARARADAEAHRADEAKLQADHATLERQKAEDERRQADEARHQAELASQQAAADRQAAEQARQQAVDQQAVLAQQAQQAQLQAQQSDEARRNAEREVQETRQRLLTQLNTVLQTRESARGLIVNMNDVLFDTGRATLKPGARVRLAKVAGIVMAYPDLRLQVEGFTDNTGSEELNRRLSERRAEEVRSFLVSQGVPNSAIVSHGFGEADPVASNSTASGRQMNRRVDLVVSGNAIGTTTVGETTTTPVTTPVGAPAVTANPNQPR